MRREPDKRRMPRAAPVFIPRTQDCRKWAPHSSGEAATAPRIRLRISFCTFGHVRGVLDGISLKIPSK